MASIDDLIADFQTQQDASQAANLERYSDILGQYGDLHARTMAGFEGFGEAQRQQLGQRYEGLQTRSQQDMVSRGLTGTTIAPTVAAGIEGQRSQDLMALDQSINQQMLNAALGITQAMLGFMERREDVGPNMGDLAQLAESLGQQQAAQEDELTFWEWLGF